MPCVVHSVPHHPSCSPARPDAESFACLPAFATPGIGSNGSTAPSRSQTSPGPRPCSAAPAALWLTRAHSVAHTAQSHPWGTPYSTSSCSPVHTPCHLHPSRVICTSKAPWVFCFLVVCQIWSFLSFFFPCWL